MVQQYNPLLETLVQERQQHLLREAAHDRLVRAAAHRGRGGQGGRGRTRGPRRLIRATLYWAGALLVDCGEALVRWSACNRPLRPSLRHPQPLHQGA